MVKDGYKFAAGAAALGAYAALAFHWNWLGGVLILLGIVCFVFLSRP
jgi:hypothetical protein